MSNPLQRYFRQPKIYVSLPSKGVYVTNDSFDGDPSNVPIYGMTGMDEIIMQTPDALLNGESTVKVLESCCPYVKNAWQLSSIDIDLLLAAIRIASFGHTMDVAHTCPKCSAAHEYSIDISTIIDHYSKFTFNNTVKVDNLTVRLKPLTYRQVTAFGIRNFELQKKLAQIQSNNDLKDLLNTIFVELGNLQQEVHIASIDLVDTGDQIVDNPEYISEWVKNLDRASIGVIKSAIKINRDNMLPPAQPVKCDECDEVSHINVQLDQSSFFARA